jgi:hypothetical protein
VGNRETRFEDQIADGVWIAVRIKRDPVKGYDWAVVLTVLRDGRRRPVCLYDNAHGFPEMHRYREGVKLAGEPVPLSGSVRHDIPAAIAGFKRKWEDIVERWER